MTTQKPATKSQLPLIVITGPTASGKSALAIKLAQRYGGEIICADSRTVYRGMDIGTAKPSEMERLEVPHHLLDVVEPDERFTAAQFKELAGAVVVDIRSRCKVPFLVGGTGLYIDSVILDYQFGGQVEETKRQQLEEESIEQLKKMYIDQQLSLPENSKNKRYLINGLLRNNQIYSRKYQPDDSIFVVAISTDKKALRSRIEQRAYAMFDLGVVEEAKRLASQYGWDSEAMTGNVYPIIRQFLTGEISREQAINQVVTRDWRLAKRQITWLKRHDFVEWLTLEDAETYLSTVLDRSVATE